MKNQVSISEKTQILVFAYQKMNNEGRDILDKFIQKLGEINGKPEKIKGIKDLNFVDELIMK